jgi:hypothetical protein
VPHYFKLGLILAQLKPAAVSPRKVDVHDAPRMI